MACSMQRGFHLLFFTDIHTTKWSNMAKSWLATIAPTGSNDHGLYYNMANNLIYISGI